MIARKLKPPEVTAAELVAGLPVLLTIDEAATALRCSRRTIQKWIALGELQTVGLSRHVRIPRAAIEALLTNAMR